MSAVPIFRTSAQKLVNPGGKWENGRPGGNEAAQISQALALENLKKPPIENISENGALANQSQKFMTIAIRMQRAADLARLIALAHPEDARPLLTAALIDLHAGMPPSEAIAAASSAAKDWAAKAGEAELAAVAKAAATELEARSLHLDEGKELLRTLFLAMDLHSRLRFLQWGKENCACD